MTDHLGDYALLGDLHTAALVSDGGGLDWLCLPRFDSPACFAALTGGRRGGTWAVHPERGGRATRRRYRPGTLVLESEWDTPEGTVRLVDCMAPRAGHPRIVRFVEGVTGRVPMRVLFAPRFDHGDRTPWLRCSGRAVSAVGGADALWLDADVPLDPADAGAEGRFTVPAGHRVRFVLTHTSCDLTRPATPAADDATDDVVGAAERFWSAWSTGIDGAGPWADAVRRAAITVTALTYAPAGAVVTGPVFRPDRTPHLCALSGASSTLRALLGAGLLDEARAWREWLVRAVAGDARAVATRYTLDGRGDPAGRTGGAGALGTVLHALNVADDLWLPAGDPAWDLQLGLLDHLESTWDRPDETGGILEHLVHSKVLAWAGFDRAVRAVERHGLPGPVDRWRAARSRLRAEVCTKGYDPDRNTFTRHYGGDVVDPALLVLPEVGFLPWQDVRVRGTVAAVAATLSAGAGDVGGSLAPGTSLTAAFRLAGALHRTGNPVAARTLFDRLLSARNDVGLFGESYDPAPQRPGPVPSAASALGMIDAARALRPTPPVTIDTAGTIGTAGTARPGRTRSRER